MVLSHTTIKEEIAAGRLEIDPFDEKNLKGASYTFTLSSKLRFITTHGHLRTDKKPDYKEIIMDEKGYVLNPEEFLLGLTQEKLSLNGNFACLLSNRGSCAQIGLDVLLSSTFAEPDTNNVQTLEIKNIGQCPILLLPGMSIAKGIFLPLG